MTTLEIEGKKIAIFGTENTSSPLVILNTYGDEGEGVWNECQTLNCPPFCLAAIEILKLKPKIRNWQQSRIKLNPFLNYINYYQSSSK